MEVRLESLAANAPVAEVNQDTPGRVRIGLLDALGINGDGAIVTIIFLPKGMETATALALENIEATDIELRDLAVLTSPVELAGPDVRIAPLSLDFGG